VVFLLGHLGVFVTRHVEEEHPYEIDSATLHFPVMAVIHATVTLKTMKHATRIIAQVTDNFVVICKFVQVVFPKYLTLNRSSISLLHFYNNSLLLKYPPNNK